MPTHPDSQSRWRKNKQQPATSAEESSSVEAGPGAYRSSVWLTVIICSAAFIVSFTAQWDLFSYIGIPRQISWLCPVLIDGAVLQATRSMVAIAGAQGEQAKKDRNFYLQVLWFFAVVSIAGNSLHAYQHAVEGFEPILAAVLATVPPIGLLFASHGLTILARYSPAHTSIGSQEIIENVALTTETHTPAAENATISHPHVPTPEHAPVPSTFAPITPSVSSPRTSAGPTENHGRGDESRENGKILDLAGSKASKAHAETRAIELHNQGWKPKEIAKELGRGVSTVYRYLENAEKSRELSMAN